MLKKTIKYEDYNGEEREEDFYFNLKESEIIELQLSEDGGIEDYVKKIVAAKNNREIVELFKKIILKAYGEKSSDGRRFMKSEEISRSFEETEAYSVLFMELATNSEAASAFMNGIIPKKKA